MSSMSGSERSHQNEVETEGAQKHKMFVTNLNGTVNEKVLQDQLKQLFKDYGTITSLTVKKSRNANYCFAFVEYAVGEDAAEAIAKLDQFEVQGAKMKVEYQDNGKRRKDSNKGCYTCGKMGHFARQCKFRPEYGGGYRGRSRSRSRSDSKNRHKKKHKKRRYSSSERSRTPKRKKQKKNRSRSRDEKKKQKKSKKRHYKESDSD